MHYPVIGGRLIRGVIYDDVDTEEIKREMFDNIASLDQIQKNETLTKEYDVDPNQVYDDIKTVNVIQSIARYNHKNINQNLIIPRESISLELENELEKLDIGRDLAENYMDYSINNNYNNCIDEEFNIKCNGNDIKGAKLFINEKQVSLEEFNDAIRKNPSMCKMVDNLFASIDFGYVF